MKLTATLSAEHRVIEQVLRCLLEMALQAKVTGKIDLESARAALTFLRTFADQCHHHKEEDVLFPALGRVGFGPDVGPVAVMLSEHQLGRAYIARIERAIQQASPSETEAATHFTASVRAYVDLLTQHIAKEDNILFPLAEQVLQGAAGEAVIDGFESTEAALDHGKLHAEMLAIADKLGARFGVSRASTPEPFRGCCHAPAAGAS